MPNAKNDPLIEFLVLAACLLGAVCIWSILPDDIRRDPDVAYMAIAMSAGGVFLVLRTTAQISKRERGQAGSAHPPRSFPPLSSDQWPDQLPHQSTNAGMVVLYTAAVPDPLSPPDSPQPPTGLSPTGLPPLEGAEMLVVKRPKRTVPPRRQGATWVPDAAQLSLMRRQVEIPAQLLRRLDKLTHDSQVSKRLVQKIAEKNPHQNGKWCAEKAIWELERDRL